MSQRRLKPSEALDMPIKLFKMFGFWEISGKYQPLYFIHGKLTYLFLVCYALCQLIRAFADWGNLHDVVDGIYLTISNICCLFKVGLISNKKLMNAIRFQNSKIFTSQQKNQDFYIIDAMKSAKRNAVGLLVMCTFVCTLWNVAPLLNGTYKQKILPFRAWYPIPQNISPYYEIAYVYQYFGVLICAWANLATDGFMVGLMTLTCGQLNVLRNSLRNLRNKAIFCIGQYHEVKICKLCDNNEKLIWKCADPVHLELNDNILEQEICNELQNCIAHHCAILECIDNYNDTFTASLFSQLTTSLITICISAFEISIITPFSTHFFAMFFYLSTIVAQIFCYCWYGNEIYLTSLTLNDDIYVSDWYRCGPRVKKIMLIMMERFKQPIVMKAGKFYTLSLSTFTSILRSTYSFYALLRQMDIDINLGEVLNEAIPEEN